MSSPTRRRIRHARRWFGYGTLVALIALALLVGIANQLLPMVERHPDRIAAWLSERVGEPVRFSRAKAEWTRRGPRLTLDGLRVGNGANALDIGRAQLQVAMYSGLLPGHPLTELKVRELSLTLVQEQDGRWHVLGLPGQAAGGDPLDRLEGFGELQIEKAKLKIESTRLGLDLSFPRVDVRLRVYGNRLLAGASAWVNPASGPMSAVLDLRRDTHDGSVWVGGDRLALVDWQAVLARVDLQPLAGTAELGVWLRLRDQRIKEATVQTTIRTLSLAPLASVGATTGAAVPPLQFDELLATARWSAMGDSWRIDAPRMSVRQGKQTASLDGLQVVGGQTLGLYGKDLDFSPLAAALCLVERVPPPLRDFLCKARPEARVREVAIHGRRGGRMHGEMALSEFSLRPYGDYPGLSGLAGTIKFDERGGLMALSGSPMRVDWPVGFRQPVEFVAAGAIGLWREGDDWMVGSHRLRLKGEDFGADVRLQLGFRPQGAPTLDMSADLDPADVQVAKRFWILHKMAPSVVTWLNTALVSGTITNGRIVIGGDLGLWPFRGPAGVFDARATLQDASLKFNEAWPVGEHLNLNLDFDGPGMSAQGNGDLAGNRITSITGGIDDFHLPMLDLDIHSEGDASRLRSLLIASPLNQSYGEHLKAATVAGNAHVAMTLALPLGHETGERKIDGTLDLANATLSDSRWGITLTEVNGTTRFGRDGFATQDLNVQFDKQPGVFNLAVGEFTGDRSVAAIAGLQGHFATLGLVNRYPELSWLRPHISGSSDWRLGLRVPATTPGMPTATAQLRILSDLVGTRIDLPTPLDKAISAPLALDLQAAVPAEQGELNLRLGSLLRFRGIVRPKVPLSGVILFGDGLVPAPTTQGLVIRGLAPALDATGWSGASLASEGASVLHDVDLQVRQLSLLDRPFANARLTLARAAASTQIQIKGEGIEGGVDIPNESNRVVQVRFAKLYLPAATLGTAPAAGASAESDAVVESPDDPARLPPLKVSIADLRLGAAQLGQADLVTSRTDTGMRVDKFQTRAKNLTLDATGDWSRGNGGTRSNFQLEFRANSLGQLLDSLGFANMVQGGKTHATLTGQWPGTPGEFSLARFAGTLKVGVGEGRLLDVEPGGSGRVLGLISLAEIPRRLTLDFSDFFSKGFSFNDASGDFRFADGQARTDNLRINGPAAEIRITGTTGMRDQVYDQQVEVLPKAGGILPAIGMLAGGPAGVAVGVVAQAIVQKPLKQTTRVLYHVSGPWAKPQVDVVERGPKRTPPPATSRNP
jgi:uncharacterized protein (TIGR02099 family)